MRSLAREALPVSLTTFIEGFLPPRELEIRSARPVPTLVGAAIAFYYC